MARAAKTKQKGTGRARQGSLRSPQFRGGGVVFGPVVRSHEHALNKKVRKLGLKTALSSKLKDGKLIVLESSDFKSAKTGALAKAVAKLGWASALIIDGPEVNAQLKRAVEDLQVKQHRYVKDREASDIRRTDRRKL